MGEDYPKTAGGRRSFAVLGEEEIFALARRIVEGEKRFLDPCLTMESLADELNIHRNALSGAVNRFAGIGFPAWLGEYRVAEVERLATLPENQDCSTAKLALMSGFSNRKSFHRVYTSLRHGKPSETLPGRKNRRRGDNELNNEVKNK